MDIYEGEIIREKRDVKDLSFVALESLVWKPLQFHLYIVYTMDERQMRNSTGTSWVARPQYAFKEDTDSSTHRLHVRGKWRETNMREMMSEEEVFSLAD